MVTYCFIVFHVSGKDFFISRNKKLKGEIVSYNLIKAQQIMKIFFLMDFFYHEYAHAIIGLIFRKFWIHGIFVYLFVYIF